MNYNEFDSDSKFWTLPFMKTKNVTRPIPLFAWLVIASILFSSCNQSEKPRDTKIEDPTPRASDGEIGLNTFKSRPIGEPTEGFPWITDLKIVDLDKDGLLDVLVCEGRMNQISWIRQVSSGYFEETVLASFIAGPAHVETADMDADGDLDIIVASMGIVTPNPQKIGSVVILENDGLYNFAERVLLENVSRVTHVEAGDLDNDGDLDLSVGQFGYYEGEVRWMENLGDWNFVSHPLLDLSGTIHAPIVDIDNNGSLDIVALVSQDWEEIHAFRNDGSGSFKTNVIWGSTNKDFGSSGIRISDIDQDGDSDIAYTNGDGFDYATPGSRPWHGVHWLENDGTGNFDYHLIGKFSGAYSPLPIDIDDDGDLDVIAVSGFNDWGQENAVSMMCYENTGDQTFIPRILAYEPTHLVVVDGADIDNDGKIELVTGGLHFYPPFDKLSRVTLWDQ
ncbi:MAG: hypothetical protein ACI92G_000675 [Candidatus Pelagisphaera sp.]